MSIGPILPGRLPASLISSRLSQNMQRATQLLQQLQDQAATGQNFFIPSEDPAAAVRTVVLQKTIERKDQMQVNLQANRSLLTATEASLSEVGTALTRAKSFVIAGAGDTSSPAEKLAMADEVKAMIQGVLNAANAQFRGRYLFGGSESRQQPFELSPSGTVRYNGDRLQLQTFADLDLTVANNKDGISAFNAVTESVGDNVNPAVTLATRISDLHGGTGLSKLGPIQVTVDNGGPVTQTVDLTKAKTLGDVKTLIENAFPPGDITVSINAPPNSNGLTLTPVAGTVSVADLPGFSIAKQLGIRQGPAATITGSDLDPQLSLDTPLSAFNNGLGATTANGLVITNGPAQATIDISSATTVEDLFNLIEAENLDLELRINDAGNGLAIASRLNGVGFGIGENGGGDAASLGIRTLTGSTLLSDLNNGLGVPVNELDAGGNPLPAEIEILRRDGSTTVVDIAGLATVQDVLDAITAVDANLTATLNSVGNGISITDTSGTGPLQVLAGEVSDRLGITGSETGSNNGIPLTGQDVNQRTADGIFSLLYQLERALRSDDQRAFAALDPQFDTEIERFNQVRGEIGSRLSLIETVENRLLDEEVELQGQLSEVFDADLADVISQVAQVSTVLQATLNIASTTLNLTLLSFL